jgi:hypothetical protein
VYYADSAGQHLVGIAPLTYIEATTPEYAALKSEDQKLQQQFNQTQAENQQLQATISLDKATIAALSQQITIANSTTQKYQAIAFGTIILLIASVVVSLFLILRSRTIFRKEKPAKGRNAITSIKRNSRLILHRSIQRI